jgi:hypothetical protein
VKPVWIEPNIADNTLLKTCCKEFFYNKYSNHNAKVIDWYIHSAKNKPQGKNSIQYALQKIHEIDLFDNFPPYIETYFTVCEERCKYMTSNEERKKVICLDGLNHALREAIDNYFDEKTEDDCDF